MAEAQVNRGVSAYILHFNPQMFLEEQTLGGSNAVPTLEEFNRAFATMFHEVFSALTSGERLLDVGSGPGLKSVMNASSKYQDITLSDPAPQNRHMLQKYMDDVTEDQRWTEHFKLTAELEGDVQKWPEVRDRMRARIKHVVWCDILQDEPLGKDHPEELFDCVMTTLCLAAACGDGDLSTLARAVRNLVSLAKPGGHVIIADLQMIETDYYYIGDVKFADLPVTKKHIHQCIEASGCRVLSFREKQVKTEIPEGPQRTVYVLVARKL